MSPKHPKKRGEGGDRKLEVCPSRQRSEQRKDECEVQQYAESRCYRMLRMVQCPIRYEEKYRTQRQQIVDIKMRVDQHGRENERGEAKSHGRGRLPNSGGNSDDGKRTQDVEDP